ncbi:DEAD-domain-containing protein [Hypoxylon sp. FL1150]|nr:DEAD-domain-containing protein [Hypoxylon sp. FL1150]
MNKLKIYKSRLSSRFLGPLFHKFPSFSRPHPLFQQRFLTMQDSRPNPSRHRRGRGGRGKKPQQGHQNQMESGEFGSAMNSARSFGSQNPTRNRDGNGLAHQGSSSASDSTPNATSSVHKAALAITVPTDTPTFTELGAENLVDPVLLQTISEDLKFSHMTPVQAATIRPLLKDSSDILAQAKTGTGKTIAFLLPAIQKMLNRNENRRNSVSLLVISPTRELAMQIAEEARALLQRLKQYKVCIAIGGTNKVTEERRIQKGCDILIGTPGRLYDHLSGGDTRIVGMLQNLDTLVLDEADRLLDMGFLDSLKKIIGCLPNKAATSRQGMLFSATVPGYVSKVAQIALSKDYKYISTIAEGELNTHERVPQHLVIVPTFSDMAAGLLGAIRQELALAGEAGAAFKAIVFAPAARLVDFYTEVLQKVPGLPPVAAIHSRMTQSRRSKITDDFRQTQSCILVATDVIARGMDFPSVTNVFQAGIPSDKESYVHRLGRTGRAGAEGRGTFIVTSHEAYFPKHTLKNIAFEESAADLGARDDVLRIAEGMDADAHAKVYQGWLGFYKSHLKALQWDNVRLVQEGNTFALKGLGAPEVPTLEKSTVGKMGLKGVKGLVVGPRTSKHGLGGGGDGGGGGYSQTMKRRRNES